jgi:hypothetical protein
MSSSNLPPFVPPPPRTPASGGFAPIAPPAPKQGNIAPPTPNFRPSISAPPPRLSMSGGPPPPRLSISSGPPLLPPILLDRDSTALSALPEAPQTPMNSLPPPHHLINRPPPSGTPQTGIITSLDQAEVAILPPPPAALADTQDNVDQCLDKFEGYRHLFDMASQGFRIEKDIFTVNITLSKVEEFISSPDFSLLLNTKLDLDVQKTAKGFKLAYEKEVEHVGKYLLEQCEVLTQMLKLFISTPNEKLSGQKDGLRQVVEESRTFSRYPGSTIKLELVSQGEQILSHLELQDGLLQQIQQVTQSKDMEKLENYLARASAAGIKADHSPQMHEAHKVFADYEKQRAKKNKTLKKGELNAPPSPFYNLTSVIETSSFFVGLNSILPFRQDYKSLPRDQITPSPTNKLPGIDVSVDGITDMPNLDYFLERYLRIPLVLYDCLQFIRYNFGWREEGLFRLSGNNDTIANSLIKYEHQHLTCLKNGGYVASEQGFLHPIYTGPFTDVHPTLLIQLFTSPHDATNVMKRWLRSLSEPIVPFESYKLWTETAAIPHTVNDTTKIDLVEDFKTSPKLQRLQELIRQLPQENMGILMYLSLYLYCVSLNSSVSKMTADNLAIVIAPNILRVKEEGNNASGNGGLPPMPSTPMSASAMLLAMKPNNDILNQSKIVNEIFGLVFKYAPVLFSPIPKKK